VEKGARSPPPSTGRLTFGRGVRLFGRLWLGYGSANSNLLASLHRYYEKEPRMSLHAKLTRPMALVAAAGIGLTGAPIVAHAADAAGTPVKSIQEAAQQGAQIFAHESFGGSGACEMCHSNGGRSDGKLPDGRTIPSLIGAAAEFPHFSTRSQSVITLSQQIGRCIIGALHGTPPTPGAPQLINLETYVTSLSKGTVMGKQFD
jgi:cytochrome c553